MLNDAITEGTWSGITKGLWDCDPLLLPEPALAILRSDPIQKPNAPKERGIFKALEDLNLIERQGWFRTTYRLTEEGERVARLGRSLPRLSGRAQP
jgi:hypothetical protein